MTKLIERVLLRFGLIRQYGPRKTDIAINCPNWEQYKQLETKIDTLINELGYRMTWNGNTPVLELKGKK